MEELVTAIGEYIDRHNEQPKPFIWTATASDMAGQRGACPQDLG
jgi:hypothetical protein